MIFSSERASFETIFHVEKFICGISVTVDVNVVIKLGLLKFRYLLFQLNFF